MNLEEEFNRNVYITLQKIKKESWYSEDGKPLQFKIANFFAAGYPSQEEMRKLVKKLHEQKVIEILSDFATDYNGSKFCTLRIIQPKFDETYKQYSTEPKKVVEVKKKRNESETSPIVNMKERTWADLTMTIMQDYRVKLKFTNGETRETDWEELGLTKTREGKLVGSKNWDFLYICAINQGKYPLKGMSKGDLIVAQQRKKAIKQILMERFTTNEDPFRYDEESQEYIIKFKILPASKDRVDIYRPAGKITDNTDDWNEEYLRTTGQ